MEKTLGEAAYEGWCAAYSNTWDLWGDIGHSRRECWQAAAEAVLRTVARHVPAVAPGPGWELAKRLEAHIVSARFNLVGNGTVANVKDEGSLRHNAVNAVATLDNALALIAAAREGRG